MTFWLCRTRASIANCVRNCRRYPATALSETGIVGRSCAFEGTIVDLTAFELGGGPYFVRLKMKYGGCGFVLTGCGPSVWWDSSVAHICWTAEDMNVGSEMFT